MSETLSLVKRLQAPRSLAFRAFVDPGQLQAWFWPPRFQVVAQVEPREGGRYSLRSDPVGIGVSGRYAEVTPPQSLTFDWTWDGDELTTTVRLEFDDAGSTTWLRLSHSGFNSPEQRDDHIQGWNDCLARLAIHLAALT
jgi:uncharacterized protein YndB with AHSA1/START domain